MANNKKISWRSWVFLALLAVCTVLIVKHDRTAWYTNQGRVFGTIYKITYQYSEDIQPLIEARLQEVDNSLSPFNAQSTITAINNGTCMETDSLFRTVWRKAVEVNALSGGAFDITVAPLVNAWGFGFKHSESVTEAVVDSLRTFIGMDKVRMDTNGKIVKEDPRIMLDCSAIAKGFGSDCVGALFDSLGIRNYMVEIGGEVVVRGKNTHGDNWRIGVNRPEDDSLTVVGELDTVLVLTDCALATSGNYRNFYYKEGKKYAHTIDPRQGYPVQHSVLSATIIAPTCMEADALATTCMVLGADSARDVIRACPGVQAYLICASDSGMVSVSLKGGQD